MSLTGWGWLILLLPLGGAVVNGLGYRALRGRITGIVGIAAIVGSFACAIGALATILGLPDHERAQVSTAWHLAATAGVDIKLNIFMDPLAIFMALVVTGVSALIHIYSFGYMLSDRGYARYFTYLNFFVFSMLLLVLAGNYVFLIVGWAFVGFASYALISFWYRRKIAVDAGRKAFVVNVVGDIGLVIAVFLMFKYLGTFDYAAVFEEAPTQLPQNGAVIGAITILLAIGAFAKSAQAPLHTWLADAMEGPTPVSSLIHAATMVTAGVYLVARSHVLFQWSQAGTWVVIGVATFTLFAAGTMALGQIDIKRAIAFSTMSQVGYMMLGVGVGGYSAGLFHLMTHAFFKSLLFMGAGSVMSAMANNLNINNMGGFRKAMPLTFFTFLAGSLALAAIPGFSGFFSKEDVLDWVAAQGGAYIIVYIVGLVGAFVTGLYTFRLVYRIFFHEPCREAKAVEAGGMFHPDVVMNPMTGEEEDTDVGFPGKHHHIADRTPSMGIPMIVLAVLATVAGFTQVAGLWSPIENFLEPTFANSPVPATAPTTDAALLGYLIGGLVALFSVGLATYFWLVKPGIPVRLQAVFPGLTRFLFEQWYFNQLLDWLVVKPIAAVGRALKVAIEPGLIQGAIMGGAANAARGGNAIVRLLQTGYLRFYAVLLTIGLFGVTLWFLLQR